MRRLAQLLVLAPLAACSRLGPSTAADAPGAEEYAVWSAALDAAFGEARPWFVVTDTTHELAVELPAGVARLRAEPGLPRELLEDYIARNGHPARVHAGWLHPRRVGLLPAFGGPVGRLAEVASGGQATLSRVGFDPGREAGDGAGDLRVRGPVRPGRAAHPGARRRRTLAPPPDGEVLHGLISGRRPRSLAPSLHLWETP
jgi:hypothetical protein